tara:strand:- start:218 stop:436 length:219 start_codon:yes stop_codon:yes gene_type:complete
MSRFKDHLMQKEDKFFSDCIDIIKESESIQEFYGRFASAEKDGDIKRPSHISQERFQEEAEEYFNEYWSKFI